MPSATARVALPYAKGIQTLTVEYEWEEYPEGSSFDDPGHGGVIMVTEAVWEIDSDLVSGIRINQHLFNWRMPSGDYFHEFLAMAIHGEALDDHYDYDPYDEGWDYD